MFVPWPVPQGNGSNAAPQGNGIWNHTLMEEPPNGRTININELFSVTLIKEFTNITGLLPLWEFLEELPRHIIQEMPKCCVKLVNRSDK